MKLHPLSAEEERVILHRGTERAFTGKYTDFFQPGTYLCRQCNAPLYRSADKFHSGCGWPSFDDEIPGAVRRWPDPDGTRTEIVCARCGGHLGHVFTGERLTPKDTRHCVNSISMSFVPEGEALPEAAVVPAGDAAPTAPLGRAVVAGGCFWGVEYYLRQLPGVSQTTVGYTGGHLERPTYRQVCSGQTGHAEAVEVIFDPAVTTYEQILQVFFEIHDPTQAGRQGPDVGEQYRSAVFYLDGQQKAAADKLIALLKARGYAVATEVAPLGTFWKAEPYHQNYYGNKGGAPYCHRRVKRF
ncbi:MAG: Peptide methionine sulfoxide reductase MsrA 3 [Lentisphaerae bacterium ADurb.BinA184]|nr:MAG: Peptide methionine sulfoxide reductase MsrA 3 [Lentisphaerae bacterium ADurb.BinA184]